MGSTEFCQESDISQEQPWSPGSLQACPLPALSWLGARSYGDACGGQSWASELVVHLGGQRGSGLAEPRGRCPCIWNHP